MPTGTIARLLIDKGFGFIRDESGVEHFFHRSAVRGAEALTSTRLPIARTFAAIGSPGATSIARRAPSWRASTQAGLWTTVSASTAVTALFRCRQPVSSSPSTR